MEYRVENKYLVTEADIALLASRLESVMQRDEHQIGDCYEIRSLYFDDFLDRCMDENEAGIDRREKYRIRIYDPNGGPIHLEVKSKLRGLTHKDACDLTRGEALQLMEGELPMAVDTRKPLNKLRLQMRCNLMQPKVIIAYERTAYVHPMGNVRVTFDRNIMASRVCEEFFEEQVSGMTPILPEGLHVLEVKYDELLPDFIARQLELGNLRQTAFSKYYLGRLAVRGEFPMER